MDKITLLEPLSYVGPDTAGVSDTTTSLTYRGLAGTVCFDKTTGQINIDPRTANVLQLHQELQRLALNQDATERAQLLCKLAQRPY